MKVEPRRSDAHKAGFVDVIPRSVSNADRCVIAPFMLIELTKRTVTMIQKAGERSPCCHVIPECETGPDSRLTRPRSRTKRQLSGSPSTKAIHAKQKYAASRPH